MPRRRPDPFEIRARQLNEEARDRRQREAILAAATPTPTPTPDLPPDPSQEPPEEPAGFDADAWRANGVVAGLMRQRYGTSWAANRNLHKLAERAAQDITGLGDGKALKHLRTTATNGSYLAALQARYGLLPGEVPITAIY